MASLFAQQLYLTAFQKRREQLERLFPHRSENHPNIPPSIYGVVINSKQKRDLLSKSYLSVILAKKLVGNIRYPQRHAQMILSRQHFFQNVKCVATLEEHSDVVNCVAFHPTAPLLATCSTDETVKLWRFSPDGSLATCVTTLEGHRCGVTSVVFHPTAPLLATGSNDDTVKLWRISPDGSSATCVTTLVGHRYSVCSVAFHPTAPLLATSSDDKTVKLWR